MNKAQLQTEAFKRLVTRKSTVAYERDNGNVFITFDGYSAFSVPEKDVCIDLSKMRSMPYLKQYFTLGDGYTEAKITRRCAMFNAQGGVLREYRAINDVKKTTWVREILLKQHCSAEYAAYIRGQLDAVKFVNRATGNVDHIIIPVRVVEGTTND